MSNFLPNGIGLATGASLGTAEPLYHSGTIRYVSSASGSASYNGLDRYHPLATLGAAVTASSAGDIIVLMSDHEEAISSTITVSNRIAIIGEGYSDGKPQAKLTIDHATADMFALAADGCLIQNVQFGPRTSASTANFIQSAVADIVIEECYFAMDEHSDGPAILAAGGAANWRIRNCTFVVTETTANSSPDSAIRLSSTMTGLNIEGCIFDAGSVGFETQGGTPNKPWAFDGSAGAITDLRVTGLSLLRGAEFKVHASSTGWINPATTTGSGKVIW